MNVTGLNCHRVASITIGTTTFLNVYGGKMHYTTDITITGVDGNQFRITAFSSDDHPIKINVPQPAPKASVMEQLEDICDIRR